MKTLLRSMFVADPSDNKDNHLENYFNFERAGLGFDQPEDMAIYSYIVDFVQQHRHVPDISTLLSHYDRTREDSILDRVKELRVAQARSMGDFSAHLNLKADDRRKKQVSEILQEAADILQKGVQTIQKDGTKTIKLGPIEAINYVMEKAHGVITPTGGSRLAGNVMADGADFLSEYDRIKLDPNSGIGQMTGLEQMDELGGAKRQELWTHAAFTGGLKSTLMLNWAYNQAVWYGHSSCIFSLEMPYAQCRKKLYAMHSEHPKFRAIHPPLDYQKIKEGQLTETEEIFLKQHVTPDLNSGEYGNIHIEVPDPDKTDFGIADIRHRAETLYAKEAFSLLFIDHALLVSPRHWVPSTTERINEVIRDSKKMAMSFNKGLGMATVLLFQISREGYKAGLKARESNSLAVYNLTNLSYANEAERSSDIVTASWIDPELSKANQALFQCLKSRDQKAFEPFMATINWPTGRLKTLRDPNLKDIQRVGPEIDLKPEDI